MTTLDKLGVNKCMIQNTYAYTCEKSSGIDDYAYSPGNLTCNIEIWDLLLNCCRFELRRGNFSFGNKIIFNFAIYLCRGYVSFDKHH